VDIETFATGNHSVIIALGAVWFDPNTHSIKERFYVTIDPIQSQQRGFRMDASTLMFWMQPEQRPAWDAWTKTTHFPPELALAGFDQWLNELDVREPFNDDHQTQDAADHRTFWANAPSFDCVLLRQHYEVLMLTPPWSFRNEMDMRTFKKLPRAKSVCPPQVGLLHNAVDDAEHQARWVQNILGEYNITV
jgi:hypothetical protein